MTAPMILLTLGALVVMAAGGLLALVTARSPRLCTFLGVAGTVAGAGLGLVPAVTVLVRGEAERARWAWDVPYGSFFVELDPLAAFFAVPILTLSALAAVYGGPYLLAYREHKSLGPPWFFYNLLAASMVLVVIARNGVLFLVAWEVMALASFFLVTFEDEKESVRDAGRLYLIATHLGTAFLLAFFILLGRQQGGALDLEAGAAALAPGAGGLLLLLALIGFGTKAGFMPLHVWLPEAHPAAPSHVSAVMSGVMIKTGIYGIVRTLTLLPEPPIWFGWVLIVLGILSSVWGILLALAQHDLKRLLAYSSVENVGIIALGLGTGILGLRFNNLVLAVAGFAGALLHVVNHALFKGLLFLGAGVVLHGTGTREMDRLGGLLRRMPGTSVAFLIGCLAICAVPPLNGFVSEFLIYVGAFRAEASLGTTSGVAAVGVIGALALAGGLAAVTFTKVFGVVFLGQPRTEQAATAHAPGPLMVGPMALLAAGCLLIGVLSPLLQGILIPVLAPITRRTPEHLAAPFQVVFAPLLSITVAALCLLGLIGVLALVRRQLLAGRDVTESDTWGCGYMRPTPRMQYTGSSYVQPVLDFFRPLLHTRRAYTPARGLFPQGSALATETPDLPQDAFYRPVFDAIASQLSRLRWLQHGNVHLYVLYIGLTVVVLLLWFVAVGAG